MAKSKPKVTEHKNNWLRSNADRIAVAALIVGIIALIPALWGLLFPETISELINNSRPPVKIEFVHRYIGQTLLKLLPSEPDQNTDLEKLDYISMPYGGKVFFSVANVSNETIILSKDLPVKIVDYQPRPENINVFLMGGGGGASYRNFVVDLPQNKYTSIKYAVFDEAPGTGETLKDIRTEEVIDFFTLTPGEVEVFSLEVRFDGPGFYKFRPGVEYYKDGNTLQGWVPEDISTIVPQNIIGWELNPINHRYIKMGKCTYAYPQNKGNYFENIFKCNFTP